MKLLCTLIILGPLLTSCGTSDAKKPNPTASTWNNATWDSGKWEK